MFSATGSKAVTLHRPGFLLDWYPENLKGPDDFAEKSLRELSVRIAGVSHRFSQFGPALKLIDGHFSAYATASRDTRKELLCDLRGGLLKKGLQRPLSLKALGYIKVGVQDTLGFELHNEQLFCSWCLLQGLLAEMATGEGKSVSAAAAAIVAALAGIPVHVISTNDYLVERDAQSMQELLKLFGVSSGFVVPDHSDDAKRVAYARDVCYVSNKQLVFDYLRDRQTLGNRSSSLSSSMAAVIKPGGKAPILRGLSFAIVDEADSVLIDDAITPLILSQQASEDKDIGPSLTAISLAQRLRENEDFKVDSRTKSVSILEPGEQALSDSVRGLNGTWKNRRYRHERARQALSALHLFQRDIDYLVRDGEVLLIDQSTGRVMPDRKLQHGLHQMLEVKEKCELSGRSETLSSMSFQTFFKRYKHLSGLTGTAREAKQELRRSYELPVISVPSHRPNLRVNCGSQFAENDEEHAQLLLVAVKQRHQLGQPVLIGTRSLAQSERFATVLGEHGLSYQILNARQDEEEAQVISQAGSRGAITIATNIAGRGTDIPVLPLIAELGGLHVIVVELNDNARIDRQLIGRCARQGDPGSFEYLLSLSDPLLQRFSKRATTRLRRVKKMTGDALWHRLCMVVCKRAQKTNEKAQARAREQVAKADEQMQKRLTFTGYKE